MTWVSEWAAKDLPEEAAMAAQSTAALRWRGCHGKGRDGAEMETEACPSWPRLTAPGDRGVGAGRMGI